MRILQSMNSVAWWLIARIASNPLVSAWLIKRAQRTPYFHITSADGKQIYMGRWWLFNPYGRYEDGKQTPARYPMLPSLRIHHIRRPDSDRDRHDHPWNARTIVLRRWYREERGASEYLRSRGYTGRLLFGEYHRISAVAPDGVYTLFITWRYRGTWGFNVNGVKVPWREYLEARELPEPGGNA